MAFLPANGATTPLITVAIVSYNTIEYLRPCLAALRTAAAELDLQIIVSDNGSTDGSAQMVRDEFPDATLIENSANLFLSAAQNQALRMARGTFYLILNSDTEVTAAALKNLVSRMESSNDIGAIGCQERDPSGTVNFTGARFRSMRIEMLKESRSAHGSLHRHNLGDWPRDSDRDVDVLTDCFLMLRTEVFRGIGGYDETLRLYFTEDDICRRVRDIGLRVAYAADCYYMHRGSRSVTKEPAAAIQRIFDADRMRYYRVHHGATYAAGVWTAVKAGRTIRKIKRAVRSVAHRMGAR